MGVARVRENALFVGLVKDATMTREYELVNTSGLWVTAAGLTPEVWSRPYHQNGFKTKILPKIHGHSRRTGKPTNGTMC